MSGERATKTNIQRLLRKIVGSSSRGRAMRLGLVLLIAFSLAIPVLQEVVAQKRYRLDAATLALVGDTNRNLSRKFSYEPQKDIWQFNGSAIKKADDPVGDLKAQLGGGGKKDSSLYSVDLPTDSSKGVTYYDSNTQLSFTLTPQFKVKNGRMSNGRVVYPIDGGKMIYTAKNNGMKEDIVLNKNIGNDLQFAYDLNLPDTLQARLLDDGSVGIYSADLALYGNINFGTDTDRAKVESARKNAEKDTLVFVLPPPVIKGSDASGKATGMFRLEDGKLVVYANNMDSLSYPATVDPSVVITSSSDFSKGNNEGNIDFPSNQINRGGLTGGSASSWATTAAFTTARNGLTSVAYNGFLYVLGGYGGSYQNDVQYAPINAIGTVGTWTPTTSFSTGRIGPAAVAYNGYMYIIGGYNTTNSYLNDVQYAPIKSDGTVGTWTATTSFTTARYGFGAAAYNSILYIAGGINGAGLNDIQYAPINANGTVGTWTATTSFTTARYYHAGVAYNGRLYILGGYDGSGYLSSVEYTTIDPAGVTTAYTAGTNLTNSRYGVVAVAYNGYLYVLGGKTSSGGGWVNTVNYVALNTDGSVGTWATTTAFTTARSQFYAAAYNGYMYVCGGNTSAGVYTNTCYYSAIATAGTLGTWTSTANFINARMWLGGAIYNGYMYIAGGHGAAQYNDVQYAPINANGTLGAWHYTHNSTDDSTTFVAGFTNIRESMSIVASGGYIYVLGGWQNTGGAGTYYNDVQYAALNANGTVGSWGTTTSFTTAREDHSAEVINGYIYIADGQGSSGWLSDVQYAPINANGPLGTWSTTASFSTARSDFGMVYHRGYIYITGGQDSSSGTLNSIQYAQVNNGGAGTVGSWTSTSSLTTGRTHQTTVAYNGYLYVAGGTDAGLGAWLNDIEYAPLNSNGTVGTWTTDSHTFTNAREGHGMIAYNGYLYIVGGFDGSATYFNDVQYAPIGSNGALTANFASTNTFDTAGRDGIGLQAYNGYMYVVGGWDNTIDHADTRYAPINSNGTVGTWTDSGNNFTNARSHLQTLINNGYLYVLGGNGTATYKDVQYASINANGTLGAWKMTNSFNGVRQEFAAGVENGYLYIMGGNSGNGTTNPIADVQYAPINANGSLGPWSHTTSLPSATARVSGVVYKGYMYVAGGFIGSSGTNIVRYTPVSAIAHKGYYSKLITLSGEYSLSTISYNGTVPGGLSSFAVKTASSNGTFGASQLGSSLSTVSACTAGTTKYVWLLATLDDASSSAFPDSVSTASATDITVNIVVKHPDPSVRLRGGKFFEQEVLQPLDTCGP